MNWSVMQSRLWRGLAVLTLILVATTGRAAGQIQGDLPTNWIFGPVGVTNLQTVRLTYANTQSGPVTVAMEIIGGKVNGATWDSTVLASVKSVVLNPGQAFVLPLDWSLVGGLGAGERVQVYARLHVNGLIEARKGSIASLEVSDLLGALVPQAVEGRIDGLAEPRPDPITVDYHFSPVIVTNRHAVRMSFVNTYGVPVRINTAILGGKVNGNMWNADAILVGQKDLLLGPGQGTVLTLNWNAIGGLAGNERAQIYGRLSVTGIISPRDSAVGSLQVTDLLGVLPGHTRLAEKDGTI